MIGSVAPGLTLAFTLALAPPVSPAEGAADVVVTALAPVDADRLADVLRIYLTGYGVRVQTARVSDDDDLRARLASARRTGEAHRAVAVVRAAHGDAGRIEIELVDLATEKALVTSVPRPPREEDLYRALALKIQALLRSTLSEADPEVLADLPIGRLVEAAISPVAGTPRARPVALPSLELGYAAVAFPLGASTPPLVLQGLWVAGALALRPWLDVALGGAALGSTREQSGSVFVVASLIPVTVAVRGHLGAGRFSALVGPSAELALASVSSASAATRVRSTRDVMLALGGEGEGRLRVAQPFWVYVRGSALGVLLGRRYHVEGQPILDISGLELAVGAGVGIDLQ